MSNISELIGKYVWRVDTETTDPNLLALHLTNKMVAYFRHYQDCCECVYLADVTGDLDDLLEAEIYDAREDSERGGEHGDSTYTWTFYNIRTSKGTITLRFNGESNGYYSEEVDFDIEEDDGALYAAYKKEKLEALTSKNVLPAGKAPRL